MNARTLLAHFVLAMLALDAHAATSTRATASPMNGNGYGLTFDGRVYIVRRGGVPEGWFATVFRPQRVLADEAGFPLLDQGAFSDFRHIQDVQYGENALAVCETSPQPFRCNETSVPDGSGAFLCYDLWIFESNAEAGQDSSLHRRRLLLRTNPEEDDNAQVVHHEWIGTRDLVGPRMRGIEPTMTRDGRLMIYQGHPVNNGEIDVLMYTYNETPCALTGWSQPRVITAMHTDATVRQQYRLGERQLRAADGTSFTSGALLRGAYPWVFPDGDALLFTAVNVPCRDPGTNMDPPGCGPRRGGLSVIGYPTNWGVAHIDGALNPDTDQTVRLFFNSPGPNRFNTVPATPGVDVWPLFGSNTSNYAELVLDDGLDGRYAGLWHFNESVNAQGELDRTRTPDSSGYFHTGELTGGASFPNANNGVLGKAIEFNGSTARVRVPSTTALNPVNALTVELLICPHSPVDCGAGNNFRALLQKGPIGQGTYSIVFEEGEAFQARVRSGGEQKSVWSNASIPVGQWSHIAYTYDGTTGEMAFYINGLLTNRATHAPGPIDASLDALFIGGPNVTAASCQAENGAFHGVIDEVKISRVDRFTQTPEPPDAGMMTPSSSSSSEPAASSSASATSMAAPSSSTVVPISSSASLPASTSNSLVTSSSTTSSSAPASSSTMTSSSTSSSQSGGSMVPRQDAGTATAEDAGTDSGARSTGCADARPAQGLPAGILMLLVLVRLRRHGGRTKPS